LAAEVAWTELSRRATAVLASAVQGVRADPSHAGRRTDSVRDA